jgi:hypothetical protein
MPVGGWERPAHDRRLKAGVVEQQAMRNGQHQHHNKRMRGRNNNNNSNNNNNNNNNRRSHNPLTRVYESNGPDVKIRGTANHVAEKYLQLARDAHTSGDPVSAENYFQHAEHYFRLIAAAQEQFRQQNPNFQPQRVEGNDQQFSQRNEENFEDGEDDGQGQGQQFGNEAPFGTREPQPYIPPNAQPFVPRDTPQPYQPRDQRDAQPQEARPQPRAPQPQPQPEPGNVDALPAFITGGAPQPAQPNGQNGYENGGQPDRFPLHRRRRRHRGPREGAPQGGEGPNEAGGD